MDLSKGRAHPMEMDVDGANISYEIVGKTGEWITLINGYSRSKGDFKFLAQKLAHLGYRVLIFDNRGSGESKVRRLFTMGDMVSDVIRLWNQEGILKSHLLGISMGGFIAQSVLEQSDAVNKLILVSTAARKSAVTRQSRWGRTLESVLSNLENYFSPHFWQTNQKIAQGMAKQILERTASEEFQANTEFQDEAMLGFDLSNVKAQKNPKVLIIHGTEDLIIPAAETQILKERFIDAKVALIPKVGHLLLAESPRILLEEVSHFCAVPLS